MRQFRAGTVEGTGAAINVELGFQPDYVKVFNIDDAGGLSPTIEWVTGMTAGHGFKGLEIADNGSSGRKSQEMVTSNGVSPYDGASGANSLGFTIGVDGDINVSGETIVYIAMRNP